VTLRSIVLLAKVTKGYAANLIVERRNLEAKSEPDDEADYRQHSRTNQMFQHHVPLRFHRQTITSSAEEMSSWQPTAPQLAVNAHQLHM
jgi:hypothetical protein